MIVRLFKHWALFILLGFACASFAEEDNYVINWFNDSTNRVAYASGSPNWLQSDINQSNVGCYAQLIWAGPDTLIDSPTNVGEGVTGDDEVIDGAWMGGYGFAPGSTDVEGMVFGGATTTNDPGWFYVRIWTQPSPDYWNGLVPTEPTNRYALSGRAYLERVQPDPLTPSDPTLFNFGGNGLVATNPLSVEINTNGTLQVFAAPGEVTSTYPLWRLSSQTPPAGYEDGRSVQLGEGQHTVIFYDADGWITPGDITATVYTGETTVITGVYVQLAGSVEVTIEPGEVATNDNARWHLVEGTNTAQQASGTVLPGVATGVYTVTFTDLTGWRTPDDSTITVVHAATTSITSDYVRKVGSISVDMQPPEAVTAGASWQLTSGPETGWQTNAAVVTDLPVGEYTIVFTNLAGWLQPSNRTVEVSDGAQTNVTAEYLEILPTSGAVFCAIAPTGAVAAGAQWRLTTGTETDWRNAGSGLLVDTGDYRMVFRSVEDWMRPGYVDLEVTGGSYTDVNAVYTNLAEGFGAIFVDLGPTNAVTAGAQWRLREEPYTNRVDSGQGLAVTQGAYRATFKTIHGWGQPDDRSLDVVAGSTVETNADYEELGVNDIYIFCHIEPQLAVDQGAKWQITNPEWKDSGTGIKEAAGTYACAFEVVTHWNEPPPMTNTLAGGETWAITATYTQRVGSLACVLQPDAATNAWWGLVIGTNTNTYASGETVTNLVEGDYRMVFAETNGWGQPHDRDVTIVFNETNSVTADYVQLTSGEGYLFVRTGPTNDLGGWQHAGDTSGAWRASGTGVVLNAGAHTVMFQPANGWLQPGDVSVDVPDMRTTNVFGLYTGLPAGYGSIQTRIQPQDAVDDGAMWGIADVGTTNWYAGGEAVAWTVGTHTVVFDEPAGWRAPAAQTAVVVEAQSETLTAVYIRRVGAVHCVNTPPVGSWRLLDWTDTVFRASGTLLTNVPVGANTIQWSNLYGYAQPSDLAIEVVEDQTNEVEGVYTELSGDEGCLIGRIAPEAARTNGARWRVTSGPDTGEQVSGASLVLPADDYTVEFLSIEGWVRPSDRVTTVEPQKTAELEGVYVELATNEAVFSCRIEPEEAVSAGAKWRLEGAVTSAWYASGLAVPYAEGLYTLTFQSISNWGPAADIAVELQNGVFSETNAAYTELGTNGFVFCRFGPEAAVNTGGQWRLTSEAADTWHPSGSGVVAAPGPQVATFYHVDGWQAPADRLVEVAAGWTTNVNAEYVEGGTGAYVVVRIEPTAVLTNSPRWRLSSGGDTNWQVSGAALAVSGGSYRVIFETVNGWRQPGDAAIEALVGGTAYATGIYTEVAAGYGVVRGVIDPEAAATNGARWRIATGAVDTNDQLSGSSVLVPTGRYGVAFSALAGWMPPDDREVVVREGETTNSVGTYRSLTNGGYVIGRILPYEASTNGGMWAALPSGGGATNWLLSGQGTNVAAGDYTMIFKPTAAYGVTPSVQAFTLNELETAIRTGLYERAGSITCLLTPSNAVEQGATWRLATGPETNAQNSGAVLTNIPAGIYTMRFGPATGWTAPSDIAVTCIAEAVTSVTGMYDQTYGAVTVDLQPLEAVANGAKWRLSAGIETNWQDSGAVVTGLLSGIYTTLYDEITGWVAPSSQAVTVSADATSLVAATYQRLYGSLTCFIEPEGAVADGARWRIMGAASTNWIESDVETSVVAGAQTVEFKPIPGWRRANPQAVDVIGETNTSLTGLYVAVTWAVPNDFDGDRRSDFAYYVASSGTWRVRYSASTNTGDLFVTNTSESVIDEIVGDFDGDSLVDAGYYEFDTGDWYIRLSGSDTWFTGAPTNWGVPTNGIPRPWVFDDQAGMDLICYDDSNGDWYIRTGDGSLWDDSVIGWGWAGAWPIPRDYDGDGQTDLAVFDTSAAMWYIRAEGGTEMFGGPVAWGDIGGVPIPADFDLDGIYDLTTYLKSSGRWSIRFADGSTLVTNWGGPTADPLIGDFDGDAIPDLGVYYSASNSWHVRYSSDGSENWVYGE